MAFIHALVLTLAVTFFARAGDAVNPGAVVRITKKGLDYARQQGMDILKQKISQIDIPEISGQKRLSIFGKARYSVNGLVIKNLQLENSDISLVPNVGLRLSISSAFIEVNGNWRASYGISLSGRVNLKVNGLSISVDLQLGSDQNGRPTVTAANCQRSISSVNVEFSGVVGWVLKLFRGRIDSAVKSAIEKQICQPIAESINKKLQPRLQTLPVTTNIDRIAAIDYSLTGPPFVTTGYLDIPLKGQFYQRSQTKMPPFSAPLLSLPRDNNHMAYIGVSKYLINTAIFVYHSAGALTYDVTKKLMPLDTSFFEDLLPKIPQMYPNRPLMVNISTLAPPYLGTKDLSISPVLDIQAYAVQPSKSLAPLFHLRMSTTAVAKLAVRSNKIVGDFKLNGLAINLIRTDVGPFSVKTLETTLNNFLINGMVPQVNEVLEEGYPLPSLKGVDFTEFYLKIDENMVLVGANVKIS
ncbi:bactericidal permeability-increasing protein-like [Discoglossus pictus]